MEAEANHLSLADWNWAVLMLGQALVGSVSPNFRQVDLAFEDGAWVIHVLLREESSSDTEEAQEICDQFSAYLDDIRDRLSASAYADAVVRIAADSQPLEWPHNSSRRTVFRMRS